MTSVAEPAELRTEPTYMSGQDDTLCDVAAASTTGPEGVNEDSFFIGGLRPTLAVRETSHGIQMRGDVPGPQSAILMIVADGMGGLSQAALASRLAVEEAAAFTLENVVHGAIKWRGTSPQSSRLTIPGLRDQLTGAIHASDQRIRKQSEGMELGSTITMGYLVWPILYTAHVGDTRAYVIRDNRLIQLTQDHRLQRHGRSTTDRSAQYWHHLLWNTLGDRHNLAQPDLSRFVLEPHDQWLLCTDALHGTLSAEEILEVCHQSVTASHGAHALVAAARKRAEDDVTVIYGRQKLGPPPPSARRPTL